MRGRRAGVALAVAFAASVAAEPLPERLSVEDCVRIALDRHPNLEAAAANAGAASARLKRAQSALLPRGALQHSYTRYGVVADSLVRGIDVDPEVERRKDRFDFHETVFGARQTLFDFGRTFDAIGASAAESRASAADVERERADVVLAARRAFYRAVASEAERRALENAVGEEEAIIAESAARRDEGLAPEYDVTQASVRTGLQRLSLIAAEKTERVSRERLRSAMGLEQPLAAELDPELSFLPLAVTRDEAFTAAAKRPEIRGAEEAVAASDLRVRELTKTLLPLVTGEATYGFTGREFPLDEGWTLGVRATLPLFDSLETGARLAEERARLAGVQARLRRLRQEIELEVAEALLELESAAASVAASAEVLATARRNLDLARGRYREGIGSILEVSDGQSGRTAAEIARVQTLAGHRIARALLEHATGRPVD